MRSALLPLVLLPLFACSSASTGPAAGPADGGAGSDAATKADAATVSLIPADREYTVTEPDALGDKPLPLVLMLHGYGATAGIEDLYLGTSRLAKTRGFLLAAPNGKRDSDGKGYWNATSECCDFEKKGTDDVAFLRAVIDEMRAKYKVDDKRIFVIGHSNGGFMGLRLACELSDKIAAVASLAGAQESAGTCKPQAPVAILQIHGTADKVVPYAGGPLSGGASPVPSAKATVAAWARLNGCGATLESAGPPRDFESSLDGAETTPERHACTKGAAELWTIQNGSHIPSFNDSWLPAVMDFLEAHPKP